MTFDWMLTAAGFGVGFLVGLTGVGGGSLMTPLLIFVFKVEPAVAVGTDLLFAAVTKTGGIWAHARRKTVEWRIAGLLALGSVPTALITIYVIGQIGTGNALIEEFITHGLGIALILTAASILFKSKMHQFGDGLRQRYPSLRSYRDGVTVLAGVLLGVLVPISSVGAGALGAAILMFLYPRIPTIRIVGTDIAHAVPLTAVAGLGHLQLGTVNTDLLVALLIGSLPGIYFGSHLGTVVPDRIMRPILASILVVIGIKFALIN
jgi:hypothetical protein